MEVGDAEAGARCSLGRAMECRQDEANAVEDLSDACVDKDAFEGLCDQKEPEWMPEESSEEHSVGRVHSGGV